jgi:hypothetical protein
LVVSVYVRSRQDAPELPTSEELARTPPLMRPRLTRAQFREQFGASAEDMQAVIGFAEAAKLSVVEADPARRLVQVSGTTAQMSKAFAVELSRYESDTEGYRGHEGPLHLPVTAADVVEGVFGLDDRRMARRAGNGGGAVPLTPPQMAAAYNFPSPANGANGTTIAILEFSGPTPNSSTAGFSQSDIDGFITNLNNTTGSHLVSTNVTAIAVDKSQSAPGNVPSANANTVSIDPPDIEVAGDIQIAVSVAQQANIVAYFAPNSEQGWVDAITQIVADTANDPSVLSISWGWTELEANADLNDPHLEVPYPFAWTQQAFNKLTAAFQSAAVIGMTVLAASGDAGSDCGEHDGRAHVSYPASDPGVLACGGTSVTSTSPLTERTWNDGLEATGGGISYLASPVSWQSGANVPASVNSDRHKGRGLPDVAGNASGDSGYYLWLYGQSTSTSYPNVMGQGNPGPLGTFGGTSAVAPLYASLVALINASLGTRVGWLNSIVYELGASDVFRDINDGVTNSVSWMRPDTTIARSPGYTSGPGWDACTGWGSIDGAQLLASCQNIFKRQIYFYMEESTFGEDEVELQLSASTDPGTFAAGWIAMDNFLPSQLGLSEGNLANPPQSSIPEITFAADTSLPVAVQSAINGMIAQPLASGPVLAVQPSLPNAPQRFMFPFTVRFLDNSGFLAMSNASPAVQSALGTLSATLNLAVGTFTNSAEIEMTTGEDPRFEDINPAGPTRFPSWESFDLRLFTMTVPAGDTATRFQATISSASTAPAFIANAISNLNAGTAGSGSFNTFDGLQQNESQSKIEFQLEDDSGNPVFNFAIARVRLTAKTANVAKAVRVFFRLFQAQNTVSDFNDRVTYRYYTDGIPFGHKIPLLGVGQDHKGNPEYVTIPCFATQRIATQDPTKGMADQQDSPNVQWLSTVPGGTAEHYFGCWIDNNQQTRIIPSAFPTGTPPVAGQASQAFDGPWPGVQLETMKTAFTAFPHQCLIAEIRYDDTPIPAGATTSTSDKLAQRNIAWLDGPNPGLTASRRVMHPVQVRPTPKLVTHPDELMILWGTTPRGSKAELYLPAHAAADILDLAQGSGLAGLYQIDPHTVGCSTADVTFIPLPDGSALAAGLLSIDLPAAVRKGEAYTISVRQFTDASGLPIAPPIDRRAARRAAEIGVRSRNSWRALEGAFRFVVTISTEEQLLLPEERLLSVLRWMELHTSQQSRWYPVLKRFVSDVVGRVVGFGGTPEQIPASPIGRVPGWPLRYPKAPPTPPPAGADSRRRFTGKIRTIVYDHFGDFDGFVVESESGRDIRFYSREPAMHELVHRAWVDRTLLTVIAERHHDEIPHAVELRV